MSFKCWCNCNEFDKVHNSWSGLPDRHTYDPCVSVVHVVMDYEFASTSTATIDSIWSTKEDANTRARKLGIYSPHYATVLDFAIDNERILSA